MKLTITLRQDTKAKDIRKEGLVPGIIYGKHLESPITVACKKNDLIKRYKEAGYSTPLTLEGDTLNQLVLIQDIQLDPVSSELIHIDFLAIKADEKVTTEIPLILTGESPLEKSGEGRVQLVKDFVEVEALPQDLPHDIAVDISSIETMSDTIFVKDLKVSDKVTILDDPEQAIVTTMTTQEETEETAPVEGTTPATADKPTEGATPAKEEEKK